MNKVRLDKWLWAARFFKTRAKAKEAIHNGRIYLDGSRPKPAREIQTGVELRIRRGFHEQTVIVQALSEHRGSATLAGALYQETPESIEKSAAEKSRRQAFNAAFNTSSQTKPGSQQRGRPTKKARRDMDRFTTDWQGSQREGETPEGDTSAREDDSGDTI